MSKRGNPKLWLKNYTPTELTHTHRHTSVHSKKGKLQTSRNFFVRSLSSLYIDWNSVTMMLTRVWKLWLAVERCMLCGYLGRVSGATAETDARLSVGLSGCLVVAVIATEREWEKREIRERKLPLVRWKIGAVLMSNRLKSALWFIQYLAALQPHSVFRQLLNDGAHLTKGAHTQSHTWTCK